MRVTQYHGPMALSELRTTRRRKCKFYIQDVNSEIGKDYYFIIFYDDKLLVIAVHPVSPPDMLMMPLLARFNATQLAHDEEGEVAAQDKFDGLEAGWVADIHETGLGDRGLWFPR